MVSKVIRDGFVAVLYSPGFGAGWSTWADEKHKDFCLFNPGLVHLVEQGAEFDVLEEYVLGQVDEYLYTGGLCEITIAWLPVGTQFRVREYDGSESIETLDNAGFMSA